MAFEDADKIEEDVKSSIDGKLSTLSTPLSYLYTACIFRVPDKPRKMNEAAYRPRLVSIGPLHHDQGHLQGMQEYKLQCLQNFLIRFGVSLDHLVKYSVHQESSVRGCYVDIIKLSSKQFSEMILLDGIFIVELLLKNHFQELRERNDILFENKWMWNDLLHDMLLLENQLPLSVTEGLLNFVDRNFLNELTLYDLSHVFFKDVGNTRKLQLTQSCYNARHFVELLLCLHRPTHPIKLQLSSGTAIFEYTRSAAELQEAGVKFGCGRGRSLFEAVFDKSRGELTLPHLVVNDSTETFFRNLVAFEQCGYYSKDITSYVILMDSLINTGKDVDLLVEHEIIKNELGESEVVADLFNNLYKEVVKTSGFYFSKLCKDLDDYSRDPLHTLKARWFKWKVMLSHDYFNSPWSFISFSAGSLLILLSIAQTIFAILQYVKDKEDTKK